MTLKVFADVEQGSDAWHDQRRGIVTASVVGQLVTVEPPDAESLPCPTCQAEEGPCVALKRKTPTPIKTIHPLRLNAARDLPPNVKPAQNDTATNLTHLLAAERITGYTDPTYMSMDMIRGVEDEPVARDLYSEHFTPVVECGFMVEDKWGFRIGYSPDGVDPEGAGLIEVKSRRQKKQLTTILADEVPPENMAQLQAGLLVSGREWIDYVSYCAGMPLYVKRVTPDPHWFEAIVAAVTRFEENVTAITEVYKAATKDLPMTTRRDELEIVL